MTLNKHIHEHICSYIRGWASVKVHIHIHMHTSAGTDPHPIVFSRVFNIFGIKLNITAAKFAYCTLVKQKFFGR